MPLVKLPDDVLERNDIRCTKGPLGIKLTQTNEGHVVLTNFIPSSDGSKGEIESSGLVRVGDSLLCVNEIPIEFEEYNDVLKLLKEGFPITLTFGKTSSEFENHIRQDIIRRALELRETEDRKRLEELEAARVIRDSFRPQYEQYGKVAVASPVSSGTGSQVKATSRYVSPAVYTAHDFRVPKFTKFQKQVAAVLVIMALFRALWTFSRTPSLEDVVPIEGEFIVTNKHKPIAVENIQNDLKGVKSSLRNNQSNLTLYPDEHKTQNTRVTEINFDNNSSSKASITLSKSNETRRHVHLLSSSYHNYTNQVNNNSTAIGAVYDVIIPSKNSSVSEHKSDLIHLANNQNQNSNIIEGVADSQSVPLRFMNNSKNLASR